MERGRKIVDEIIAFPSRSGCAKITSPPTRELIVLQAEIPDQPNGQDIKRSFRAFPSPPSSLSGPCEISREILPMLSLLAGIIENGPATLTRPCFPSSNPTLRIRGRRNFSKLVESGATLEGICSISFPKKKKKTCNLRNHLLSNASFFLRKFFRHARNEDSSSRSSLFPSRIRKSILTNLLATE